VADNWYTGNANDEADAHRGWMLGHFITPPESVRSATDLEIKWGIHPAGQQRHAWSIDEQRTTLLLLVSGRFRLDLSVGSVTLERQGEPRGIGTRHRPFLAGRARLRRSQRALAIPARLTRPTGAARSPSDKVPAPVLRLNEAIPASFTRTSRTVVRDAPCSAANSRSEGSLSPARKSRARSHRPALPRSGPQPHPYPRR
jgi:hypothetical protein